MENYTELQRYAIDYVTERKNRITKQIDEINKKAEAPDILYSEHEELMNKKIELIKAFDDLTNEYRSIANADLVYKYYRNKEAEFRKKADLIQQKWGLPNEED